MDEEEVKRVVGQRIREARRFRNLTQEGLAELAKPVGATRISNYEQGTRLPDRQAVNLLAAALQCPPLWLGAFDLMMDPDERALWYKYWATDQRGRDSIQSNAGAQPATHAGPWVELHNKTG